MERSIEADRLLNPRVERGSPYVNTFASPRSKRPMATAARVNGETLRRHIGAVVRIVGELRDPTSDPFTIMTTDGQSVTVHRQSRDPPLQPGWVEITGQLQGDSSILENFTVQFEGEIDRDAWNQMVTLMHRHDEIFA
jgi:hypothetical protein